MSRNLWQTIQSEVRGGPMVLSIFISGLAAFILSLVLSFEDFMSSLAGLYSLQEVFGIQAVSFPFVLYFMAAAPQIGQIVFLALWSLDTSRKWALVAGIFWFLLDFIADVQFRSADTLFPLGGGVNANTTVLISAIITFIYFTVGAELFMVAGSAIVLTLYADARRELGVLRSDIRSVGKDNQQRDRKNKQQPQQSRAPQSGAPRGQEVGRIEIPHDVNDIDRWIAEMSAETGQPVSRRQARQQQGNVNTRN